MSWENKCQYMADSCGTLFLQHSNIKPQSNNFWKGNLDYVHIICEFVLLRCIILNFGLLHLSHILVLLHDGI